MMLEDTNPSRCLLSAQTLLIASGAKLQTHQLNISPEVHSDPRSMWLKGSSCFSCSQNCPSPRPLQSSPVQSAAPLSTKRWKELVWEEPGKKHPRYSAQYVQRPWGRQDLPGVEE